MIWPNSYVKTRSPLIGQAGKDRSKKVPFRVVSVELPQLVGSEGISIPILAGGNSNIFLMFIPKKGK